MGLTESKVALITGAARGQGRSHAVRLAEEGADIIALDVCRDMGTVHYPGPSSEDLEETLRLVREHGRRATSFEVDVRDAEGMREAINAGATELGGLDIVCANAGILGHGPATELTTDEWSETVDINLTGVWNTVQPALAVLVEQGRGGSIVITSSTAGIRGAQHLPHYSATKHGVVGLARSLALEFGRHFIRVNTVHPTAILTPMIDNPAMFKRFRPEMDEPTADDAAGRFQSLNILPLPYIESIDISNAIVWLCSDLARYVTGAQIPIDAGATQSVH